jgi:arylformamidase
LIHGALVCGRAISFHRFMKSLLVLGTLALFVSHLSAAEPASASNVPSAPAKSEATKPAPAKPAAPPLPTPTHANVSYGPHERNVLDVWLAKSDKPTPLVVHIHGGGWLGGDKKSTAAATVKFMLEHGVSVAAINYRYSTIAPLPAPVHDAARAIQFLRSKAGEWNIDKTRVAAFGGSAGACTSLWLNYHDDLANPKSSDPVERESSRLCAAVGFSGQTSIDPKTIVPWVGEQVMNHAMISRSVGAKDGPDALARYEEFQKLYGEFSAYTHVDKNDPPVLLVYPKDGPVPAPDPGAAIHHANFGKQLKEKTDSVGASAALQIGGAKTPGFVDPNKFLLRYLKP